MPSPKGGQISSLHLAIAAGGGVLIYAALRGVSPAEALRDITSGSPPAVSTEGKVIAVPGGSGFGDANGEWRDADYIPGGYGSEDWKNLYKRNKVPRSFQTPMTFLAALQTHRSETYSQGQRWAKGHSDCASFVGKGLLDIGVTPPGTSRTTDYLSSPQWVKVTSPRMGDVAVNSRHMIVCTDGARGLGQQNSRRNVKSDTIDNLMANTGGFEIRRYRGWGG